MDFRWITDAPTLQALVDGLPEGAPLFLDTEFMRERTFWPKLALVQINTGSEVVLIDVVAFDAGQGMAQLLARHPLVMHSCSEDLEALRVCSGRLPVEIHDTQIAAALCGHDMQCSYQRLVSDMLGVDLPKDVTRSDWLKRPLSERQVEYAVQDVLHLPQLYEHFSARLEELGRLSWWQEECQRLLASAANEARPEDAWRQVKGAGGLQGVALARLVALAGWREQQARQRDLPRGFVIRDPELLSLAQQAPDSQAGLKALGLHPSLLRRDGETLLQLLDEGARQLPPPPLPGPPDPAQRALAKRLKKVVAGRAEALALVPEILMRRRWLESLINDAEHPPEPLGGWRREVITGQLLEALNEQ